MIKQRILLILLLIMQISCNKSDKNEEQQATQGTIPFVDSVVVREGLAPDFFWRDESGKLQNFSSIHKKATIINFWATWCSPCKKEIPDLIAINKEMADKGVKVIGISTDKGIKVQSEVDEFVKSNKIDYPIVIDDGKLSEAFGNIRGLPTTFIIDEKGNISKKFLGIKTKEFFISQLEEILK